MRITRISSRVLMATIPTVTLAVCLAACSNAASGTTTGAGGGAAAAGSLHLPLITPPVAKALPAGLLPPGVNKPKELDRGNFKGRFFSGAGPTDLFSILKTIDSRLSDINAAPKAGIACVTAPPAKYTLSVLGASVDMYGQCFMTLASDGFVQFGVKDGVTYLYVIGGAGEMAAIMTPTSGGGGAGGASGDGGVTGGDYTVQAWIGVGLDNAKSCGDSGTFDGCSYGVMQIAASSSASTFEMSVGGLGFGFCGAQIRSDGASIFGQGSEDGADGACKAVDTLCTDATDFTKDGSCGALKTFTIPALGRKAVMGLRSWADSAYPSPPNVTLDGSPTDSLHFGPTSPSMGVGEFKP